VTAVDAAERAETRKALVKPAEIVPDPQGGFLLGIPMGDHAVDEHRLEIIHHIDAQKEMNEQEKNEEPAGVKMYGAEQGRSSPGQDVGQRPKRPSRKNEKGPADQDANTKKFLAGIVFPHGGDLDFPAEDDLLGISTQNTEPLKIIAGKCEYPFREEDDPTKSQKKERKGVQGHDDPGDDMDPHGGVHRLFLQRFQEKNDACYSQRQKACGKNEVKNPDLNGVLQDEGRISHHDAPFMKVRAFD
jgi:hypothetical protein